MEEQGFEPRGSGSSSEHPDTATAEAALPTAQGEEPNRVQALPGTAVLAQAIEAHHPRIALACSFQKEESVLLHMLMGLVPDPRVFTIDTGVLFTETHSSWREMERRFAVKVEIVDAARPWSPWTSTDCCSAAKVAALQQALDGLDAWITGLRREQAPTRAVTEEYGWDDAHGLWKVNPLVEWSERDVWAYIAERDLPYNRLHDQGYASIGCAPCTLPGSAREGRWAGQAKTECGLHTKQ